MFHVSGILHYMYLNASQKIAGAAMKRLWLAQIGEIPGLEGRRKPPAHGVLWSNLRSMATLRQAPRPIPPPWSRARTGYGPQIAHNRRRVRHGSLLAGAVSSP